MFWLIKKDKLLLVIFNTHQTQQNQSIYSIQQSQVSRMMIGIKFNNFHLMDLLNLIVNSKLDLNFFVGSINSIIRTY